MRVGMADWAPVEAGVRRRTAAWLDTAREVRACYAYEQASGWFEHSARSLSLALQVPVPTASVELHAALALGRLPRLERAARDGRLHEAHVKAFLTGLEGCTPELVPVVVAGVLDRARAGAVRTPSTWKALVRREVDRVDAGAAARRRRLARGDRHVRVETAPDGMAWVQALVVAEDALAVSERLDQRAADLRAQGDGRTLQQLHADVLVAEVTGSHAADGQPSDVPVAKRDTHAAADARGRRALVADLVIPAASALGQSDEPADLRGYGPVSAAHGRDVLTRPGTVVRALFVDPCTGEALAFGRSWTVGVDGTVRHIVRAALAGAAVVPHPTKAYAPTDALVRLALARDPHSLFPTSSVPSWRADLDHRIPYDDGGPTALWNIGPADRGAHRMKQRGFTWTRTRDGRTRWKVPGRRAAYRASPWRPPPPIKQGPVSRS